MKHAVPLGFGLPGHSPMVILGLAKGLADGSQGTNMEEPAADHSILCGQHSHRGAACDVAACMDVMHCLQGACVPIDSSLYSTL